MLKYAVLGLAIVVGSVSAGWAQPAQLPPVSATEAQLHMQLGEALLRLGMAESQLANITKERDELRAKQPEPEKKGPDVK